MTRKELEKACENKTWLVDMDENELTQITSWEPDWYTRPVDGHERQRLWITLKHDYGLSKHFRLATASDMIELEVGEDDR